MTVRPCFTRPTVGASVPGQQLQQRRLAGPVDADDPDAIAGSEPPGRTRQQHLVPASEVDVFHVDDVLAQPLGGEPLEFQSITRRGYVVDECVRRVDAELRLRGSGRSAASQPGQLLAHQILPTYLRRSRLPLAFGLGQHKGGVPAFIHVNVAVMNLPGPLANLIEEPAIVGHHHHRRRPRSQMLSQPGNRLHVEVVGGLVEHDQIVFTQQQFGQRTTATFAP